MCEWLCGERILLDSQKDRQERAPVIDKTAESSSKTVINRFVAERLLEAADLLDARQDNPFRIGVYRKAAKSLGTLDRSSVAQC